MKVLNKKLIQLQDFNIYGDLAGRATEFFSLQKKLGGKAFALGDICDRGPDTKKLFDFFLKEGKVVAGNHDFMMYDWLIQGGYFSNFLWLINSAGATLKSFIPEEKHQVLERLVFKLNDNFALIQQQNKEQKNLTKENNLLSLEIHSLVISYVDKVYIDFLGQIPLFYEDEEVIITHAPLWQSNVRSSKRLTLSEITPQWRKDLFNKVDRVKPKDKIQIFGHLNLEKPKVYLDSTSKPFALCLDGSKGKKIWCYQVNEDKLVAEDYI